MWATSSTSCGISRSCYRECRCFIFSLLSYDSLYPPASPHLATWIPHISPCHASPNFQRVSLPSHISPSHSLSLFVLRSRLYPTQNSASHSFTTNSRPSIWYFCSTIYSLRSYNCSHWPGCVAQSSRIFSLLIGLRQSWSPPSMPSVHIYYIFPLSTSSYRYLSIPTAHGLFVVYSGYCKTYFMELNSVYYLPPSGF